MEPTSGLTGRKIALLIDFDNVILGVEDPGFDVELVVNALRTRGLVVMGRAYGDWYRHNRHRRKLMEQGIELVETPVFGPLIKNSADIRIVLDGFEIAMSQAHIDTFCLVSGDSDFLPLIKKLQYLGKQVIVIAGNKFTSELVRRNCNEYISYENLLAESVGATEDVSSLEGAFQLLHRTIITLNERGMDVRSSTVKQMMLQLNPAFSERTFGCAQFKSFLDKAGRAGIVRLGEREPVSGEYAVLLTEDVPDFALPVAAKPVIETAPAVESRLTEARPEAIRDEADGEGAPSRNGRRNRRGRGRRAFDDAAPETTEAETLAGALESHQGEDAEALVPQSTAPATSEGVDEIADGVNGSHTNLLLGRSLRRGRLRFTAKSGTTLASSGAPSATTPEETSDVDPIAVGMEAVAEVASQVEGEMAEAGSNDALGLTLEAVPPVEALVEATPEATPDDATPEIAPAAESPDATPEAIAAEAVEPEVVEEDAKPVKKRATRGGRRRKTAAPAEGEATPAPDAPEAVAAEPAATPEAPTEVPAEASVEVPADATDAPARKPRRRRSTKTKAPGDQAAEPSGESEGSSSGD